VPRRNLLVIVFAAMFSVACYAKADRHRFSVEFKNAFDIVAKHYYFGESIEPRTLFNNAMEGLVSNLDRNSHYFPPREYNSFQTSIDQQFSGVGMMISPVTEEGAIEVNPMAGSPALKAGVRRGDRIVSIGGKSTAGMKIAKVSELIRGPLGTSVTFSVLHKGSDEPVAITVVRANIDVDSVMGDTQTSTGKWNFFLADQPRIGYMRISTFGEQTAEELELALKTTVDQIDGLIIDLRWNPGGLLTTAIASCDMFISNGVIVSTKIRGGHTDSESRASQYATIVDPQLPVIVLINEYSASASEIFSACLQDHQRATIVGQRSFGKGTVQSVLPLDNGRSALKLTTGTYWRPNNLNIHRREGDGEEKTWGVTPDVEVKVAEEVAIDILRQRDERANYVPGPDGQPTEITVVDTQLEAAIKALRKQQAVK